MSSSNEPDRPSGALRRSQPKPSSWSENDLLATTTALVAEPEPVEPKKKRLSRRVSFADTCLVKEFVKDGYGPGEAGVEASLCNRGTVSAGNGFGDEHQELQQHQESASGLPFLSAASIQSLLTAPLAASSGTSGDDRMSTQLYMEMTDVYEKPIKSIETSSSSEESRQTTKDYTNASATAHRATDAARPSDRRQQLSLNKTVHDVDTSMQLTMSASGVWQDDDKVEGAEHKGSTTCYFDESMEMTIADYQPIELRPVTNGQKVVAGMQRHDRQKQSTSDPLCLGRSQGGTWQPAEVAVNECDKENVLSSARGAAKVGLRSAVLPSGTRGRLAPVNGHGRGSSPNTGALRSAGMAYPADVNATVLVATDMDLTVTSGSGSGVLAECHDVTDLGEISMDMTIARPTRIRTDVDDDDEDLAQPTGFETRHFADAAMSIVCDTLVPATVSLNTGDVPQACRLADVACDVPKQLPAFPAAAAAASHMISSGAPDAATAVPDVLAAITEDISVTSCEIPRFTRCSYGTPAAAYPQILKDMSVTLCDASQPTQADISRCREPMDKSCVMAILSSASSSGDSVQYTESHTVSRKLGLTMLEDVDLALSTGSLSAGNARSPCHMDSMCSLPDANRVQLSSESNTKLVEPAPEPSIEDTAWLLRDSIRVSTHREDLDITGELVPRHGDSTRSLLESGGVQLMSENREQSREAVVEPCIEDTAWLLRNSIGLSTYQEELSDVSTRREELRNILTERMPCSDSSIQAPKDAAVPEQGLLPNAPAMTDSRSSVPFPDNCSDILEFALSKLHVGRDITPPSKAQTSAESGPPTIGSMATLLQELCEEACRDPSEDTLLVPLPTECDADLLRSLHHTYLVQPLQAQLRLACDQLSRHCGSLQLETAAIENQLRRSVVETSNDNSKAGSLVQQVVAADGDELLKLQDEFRLHQDRLDAVLEAKYEEWLSKCLGNVADCWMESAGLLDAASTKIQDSIRKMSEKLDEGQQLGRALDCRIEALQQQRRAEEPSAEELAHYEKQCREFAQASEDVKDGTRAMDALLETKRDLAKRKDDLEKMYNEYVGELRRLTTTTDAAARPGAAAAASADLTDAGGIASSSSTDFGPVARPDSRDDTCVAAFRAWTLELASANGISVSFFHGTVVLDVKLESASPSEQRCITSIVIQSLLDESSEDAATLAVNTVVRYFNENHIPNKYQGSQLVKEMLLEMSFVALHMDELAVEIVDARLRRDCIISSLHDDDKQQHLVRLEVSFHSNTALTKFWLLLDFDALLYPNDTFCITFEEDLGVHRNPRHIENVAASVRPGLHYLSRLIDTVCRADAAAPT